MFDNKPLHFASAKEITFKLDLTFKLFPQYLQKDESASIFFPQCLQNCISGWVGTVSTFSSPNEEQGVALSTTVRWFSLDAFSILKPTALSSIDTPEKDFAKISSFSSLTNSISFLSDCMGLSLRLGNYIQIYTI